MSRIFAAAVVMTAMIAAAQTSSAVATGAGNQTDPHISGTVVAYTDDATGKTRISFTTIGGTASTIDAQTDDYDSLSDISGSTIVFVRSNGTGSNILTYSLADGTTMAVDPQAEGTRSNAAVGGRVVAFEDDVSVRAYDLGSSSYLFTTSGSSPAVSADGTAVAYVSGGNVILRTSADWATATTLAAGTDPDTSGTTTVYLRGGDIAWTDSSGESVLTFAGTDSNPNISGNLVAFEHDSGGQTDLYLIDTGASGATPIQLTNTPGVSETLNDVYVDGSTVRVVYVINSAGNDDVHVVTYETGVAACDWPTTDDAATACDHLWGAEEPSVQIEVERQPGKPATTSVQNSASGEGFICVRSKTPTGSVKIDGAQVWGPSDFNGTNQKLSRGGTLENGATYSASISGAPAGSTLELRVFARNDVCPVIAPPPSTSSDPLTSDEGGVGFGKKGTQGCTAADGNALVLFVGLLALMFAFRRTPAHSAAFLRGARRRR